MTNEQRNLLAYKITEAAFSSPPRELKEKIISLFDTITLTTENVVLVNELEECRKTRLELSRAYEDLENECDALRAELQQLKGEHHV